MNGRRRGSEECEWRLTRLFSTKLQTKITEILLRNPEKHFSIREMARRTGASPSGVKNRIERMEEEGYLRAIPSTGVHLFTLDTGSPLIQEILSAYEAVTEDRRGYPPLGGGREASKMEEEERIEEIRNVGEIREKKELLEAKEESVPSIVLSTATNVLQWVLKEREELLPIDLNLSEGESHIKGGMKESRQQLGGEGR